MSKFYFVGQLAILAGVVASINACAVGEINGPAGERPLAHNTGPSNEAILSTANAPPSTITRDGAVYENFITTSTVYIQADNVTLRNFRIHDTGSYGISAAGKGAVIEDGEIYNVGAGVQGSGWTGRRLHIHDVETDAMKAGGNVLVEHSFIEKCGIRSDAHADGNQTIGGSNITFRYNNIWMPSPGTPNYPGSPYKSNANFMNSGNNSNIVIESNWLNGGTYTIYCGKDGSRGVSVRNNRFGQDYQYGIASPIELCDEWSGNVWEDTGDPISR